MGERSDQLYHAWRESSDKFDYFVTGVSGAVTAYVGQNLHAARLGVNPPTVELLALAALVGSVVCGFKRIESIVHFHRLQTQSLHADEARGSAITAAHKGGLSINPGTGDIYGPAQLMQSAEVYRQAGELLDPIIRKESDKGHRYYKWRNRLLFFGFALLVAARVFAAYV